MPAAARRLALAAAVAGAGALAVPLLPASAAGTVSGIVWQDDDRDGAVDAGEAPVSGAWVQLFDATTGSQVAGTAAGTDGRYSFSPATPGTYRVQLHSNTWTPMRNDWVPTTTIGLQPTLTVDTSGGPATADFGLRRIVRSTVEGQPISRYVGPSGLTVESYDDVVGAESLHAELATGLIGAEAPTTVVRFDLDQTNHTVSSWAGEPGSITRYEAKVYASYLTWLTDGGASLFHEYGHAWSLRNAAEAQQDPTLAGYLEARGLAGDPRIGSSVAWQPREMVAEDYRQLFAPATAAARPQENRDVPLAADVPGLRSWLADVFPQPATGGGGGDGGGSDEPPPPPPPPALDVTDLAVTPLPVSTTATVSFGLTVDATVDAVIRDGRGRTVRTLAADLARAAGSTSLAWDRRDDRGRKVKSGTYVLVVSAAAGSSVDEVQSSVPVK